MKQNKISQSYNDGIVRFIKYTHTKDKFNTKLSDKTEKEIRKFWFRYLGVTANEKYQSLQVDTEVSTRIAIRLFHNINDYLLSDLYVIIKNKSYVISRIYHNHVKNETELSLVEVIRKDDQGINISNNS